MRQTPSTFESITRHLDPASSYVIFEKESREGDTSALGEVMEMLARLNLPVRSTECRVDDQHGKILLIVRFDSGRADEILQKCVEAGIPGDVLLYAYGSHVEG